MDKIYSQIAIPGDQPHFKRLAETLESIKIANISVMEGLIGLSPLVSDADWLSLVVGLKLPTNKEIENPIISVIENDDLIYERFGTRDFNWSEAKINNIMDNLITIQVYTAWNPPIPFMILLTQLYKLNAVIFFDGQGFDFPGKATFNSNGLVSCEILSHSDLFEKFPDKYPHQFMFDVEVAKNMGKSWADFHNNIKDYYTETDIALCQQFWNNNDSLFDSPSDLNININ